MLASSFIKLASPLPTLLLLPPLPCSMIEAIIHSVLTPQGRETAKVRGGLESGLGTDQGRGLIKGQREEGRAQGLKQSLH